MYVCRVDKNSRIRLFHEYNAFSIIDIVCGRATKIDLVMTEPFGISPTSKNAEVCIMPTAKQFQHNG